MAGPKFLLVYDAEEESSIDRDDLHDASAKVPIRHGTRQFSEEMAKLVQSGATFEKCLFFAHGNPGAVLFNHTDWNIHNFSEVLDGTGYERLFPTYSRIYFDGCNVAEGNEGWTFLELVGKTFLKNSGGVVSGYIGKGIGFWHHGIVHMPIPFINPDEGQRRVFFGAGGEIKEWIDEIGAELYPIAVKPLSRATLKVTVPPRTYDNILLPVLERRIRNGREALARNAFLEKFFSQLESFDARAILAKLELHRGDKLTQAFRYHLSAATRMKLLGILRDRAGMP